MKIQVSSNTYNEIAAAMAKEGRNIKDGVNQIILQKEDNLEQPINFQLVLVKKDCLIEAVKCNPFEYDPIGLATKMYEWLLTHKSEKEEWK